MNYGIIIISMRSWWLFLFVWMIKTISITIKSWQNYLRLSHWVLCLWHTYLKACLTMRYITRLFVHSGVPPLSTSCRSCHYKLPAWAPASLPRRIRSIIHQNDGKEEGCDERDGWCVPRTADELRDIMSAMIKHTVRDSGSGNAAAVHGRQSMPARFLSLLLETLCSHL